MARRLCNNNRPSELTARGLPQPAPPTVILSIRSDG
jgi:hypothetical protein